MKTVSCEFWWNGLLIFSCFCCFLSIPGAAFAQARLGEEIGFINEVWEVHGDTALIHYDLLVPDGKTAYIEVVLRRRNDPQWSVIPTSLSGDCGSGVSGGPHKEIRWKFFWDCTPEMLAGDDFYFELVPKLEESRTDLWYYVAGGAAILAATVLGLPKGTAATAPAAHGLPYPPVIRPTQ
jgi:hypothetical protein